MSGIASADVDGYLAASNLKALSKEYLLSSADDDANVVIHVMPAGRRALPDSKLQLAVDLAEYRGPREELRAARVASRGGSGTAGVQVTIALPPMPHEQTASWLGLLDLYNELSEGWTLIGGQLVHLYCAERGETAMRPTNDADMVIDIRASPTMLRTFTQTLSDLGFTSAGISAEGRQHRWIRDAASFDVLIPEGTGDRASARRWFHG